MFRQGRGRTCHTLWNDGAFRFCVLQWQRGEESASRIRVNTIKQHEDIDSEESYVYVISDIYSITLDDSELVTLKLVNSGSFLRFQPDTGAQCNVIPMHLYKQACTDEDLSHDRSMKSTISLFPCFDVRDELVVPDMIVFKDHQLVVPAGYTA